LGRLAKVGSGPVVPELGKALDRIGWPPGELRRAGHGLLLSMIDGLLSSVETSLAQPSRQVKANTSAMGTEAGSWLRKDDAELGGGTEAGMRLGGLL
jgi:hypothetical protein